MRGTASQSLPLVALCHHHGRRLLGFCCHTFTNAWAAGLDYLIWLSVLARISLMGERIENWYVWLAVNTLAVPLYMTRGLNLTAGLCSSTGLTPGMSFCRSRGLRVS
ncbi:nicotinamide mononucleotide transporter [Shigella flexneri]